MLLWDNANVAHIARHNVQPEEVEQAIRNEPLELMKQFRNNEARIVLLGQTDLGRVLFIVVTEEMIPRTVTARSADRRERKYYATIKANRNVKDT